MTGVQPVALVAAKEEGAILQDRSTERVSELVLRQLRLRALRNDAVVDRAKRVEVIPGIERVITEVLEHGATEAVAAGLGDDTDLAAGAGSVLRGIVARLHAELLHVLEARLQAERRPVLTVHVAGRGVDDRGALDAVIFNDVLVGGSSGERNVLPGAVARVLRAGRLQHQLRHLAAIDR